MTPVARLFSAGFLVCAMTGPAIAQNADEVTILIDGEEHILSLWAEQSDWSGSESWPSISILARGSNGAGTLTLGLSFEASGWSPSGAEMDLSRFDGGERVLHVFGQEEAERGGITVELDGHEIDGSRLSLTGRFTGTLGPSKNFGRDIDLSDGVPVSGSFSVTLETLE